MKKKFTAPEITIFIFAKCKDVLNASTNVYGDDNGMGWIWGSRGDNV